MGINNQHYEIINGEQLRGQAPGAERPDFYSYGKDDQRYVNLLQDSQPYFSAISSGAVKLSDGRYYIRAPKAYLQHKTATHVDILNEDSCPVQAKFVHVDHAVRVRPCEEGWTYDGWDGRHRYEAARNHGLDLLVQIAEPEDI